MYNYESPEYHSNKRFENHKEVENNEEKQTNQEMSLSKITVEKNKTQKSEINIKIACILIIIFKPIK